MIQEEVYGTYVEKVLGVERDNYFNAGMLVINCEQFRKNHVLKQFMELLPMYNFVVTQDEDYLNLICHNKVCWLPQKAEVECGSIRSDPMPRRRNLCAALYYGLEAMALQ